MKLGDKIKIISLPMLVFNVEVEGMLRCLAIGDLLTIENTAKPDGKTTTAIGWYDAQHKMQWLKVKHVELINPIKAGDLVKVISLTPTEVAYTNDAITKEHRSIRIGDILKVHSVDKEMFIYTYVHTYALTKRSGEVLQNLYLSQVVNTTFEEKQCICLSRTLFLSGCICGYITRKGNKHANKSSASIT